MRTYKKETRSVDVPDKIKCNKCGGECDTKETLDAYVRSGPTAKHLDNMTEYSFDLCGKCLKELFESFKIAAEEVVYE